MPFAFHADRQGYIDQQYRTTRDYILPFVERHRPVRESDRVLEIGCGEGGVLRAFLERGCEVVGVDLDPAKIEAAREHLHDDEEAGRAAFAARDIYEVADDLGRFDLIVLKDAIEHIPDQGRLLGRLRSMLADGGIAFFAFPPWQMPFGGHQQIAEGRAAMLTPWYHLLPERLYRRVLERAGERPETIEALLEIKETGLSIERFERLLVQERWRVHERTLWLVNPIYRDKFGLTPRRQASAVAALPGVRDVASTCAYYLVG